MTSAITVRHNIEVAHRLSLLLGKCENIHGHSMWINLTIFGRIDNRGLLAGLDYGGVKKLFRGYLDTEYDHRLLLNADDPLIQGAGIDEAFNLYPGLNPFLGDPTTERIAQKICEWANEDLLAKIAAVGVRVEVWETAVNAAVYSIGEM